MLDRTGPVAELPGVARGCRRAPSTRDPGARDESALDARADALCGRCVRNRGGLKRPAPGPGTWASGDALGGRLRDHLSSCQGTKVATRRPDRGHIGAG